MLYKLSIIDAVGIVSRKDDVYAFKMCCWYNPVSRSRGEKWGLCPAISQGFYKKSFTKNYIHYSSYRMKTIIKIVPEAFRFFSESDPRVKFKNNLQYKPKG